MTPCFIAGTSPDVFSVVGRNVDGDWLSPTGAPWQLARAFETMDVIGGTVSRDRLGDLADPQVGLLSALVVEEAVVAVAGAPGEHLADDLGVVGGHGLGALGVQGEGLAGAELAVPEVDGSQLLAVHFLHQLPATEVLGLSASTRAGVLEGDEAAGGVDSLEADGSLAGTLNGGAGGGRGAHVS